MDELRFRLFEVEHVLDPEDELATHDLPASVAKLRLLLAEAVYQAAMLASEQRSERAKFLVQTVRADLKISEWKASLLWEQSASARAFHDAAAVAARTAAQLEALLEALASRR